jgi:hypothetical protein
MEVQPDFREPLALFNKSKVEYMIVGAYALGFRPEAGSAHCGRASMR